MDLETEWEIIEDSPLTGEVDEEDELVLSSESLTKKKGSTRNTKPLYKQGAQPVRAGICRDANGKLVGSYLYLQEEDQELLDAFCRSWLRTYAANPKFMLCVDLETQGLNPVIPTIDQLLQSVSWNGRQAIVFEHHKFDCTLYKEVLNTVKLINQNLKFDAKFWIQKWGLRPNLYWCTMTAAQMGWAGAFPGTGKKFSLDNIVSRILVDYKMEKETRSEFINKPALSGYTLNQIEYAARDTLLTYQLYQPQYNRLKNQGLLDLFLDTEMQMLEILAYRELQGVDIDVKALDEYYTEREAKWYEIDKKIQAMISEVPPEKRPKLPKSNKSGKHNVGSCQQLPLLLEMYDIKVADTKAETLLAAKGQNNHPFLNLAIESRELQTEISKQAKAWREKFIWEETNKIYPTFYGHGTETSRFAASEPPVQQTTEKMRPLIIAPNGWSICSNDMSQFEFRACAAYTLEEALVQAFEERAELLPQIEVLAAVHGFMDADKFCKAVVKGKVVLTGSNAELVRQFNLTDVHRRNAALLFGISVDQVTDEQRTIAKTFGYAVLYGSKEGTIQIQLAKNNIFYRIEECKALQATFFSTLNRIKTFIADVHAQVKNGGYIENWVGRKRFFALPPKYKTSLYKKELADNQREAVNWYFQCTNAHAIKAADIELYNTWENEYAPEERPRVVITMHDELVTIMPDQYAEKVCAQQKAVMLKHASASVRGLVAMEISSALGKHWQK